MLKIMREKETIWMTAARVGGSQGFFLAGVGLAWGALAGWLGVLLVPADPAALAGNLYGWLALLLPLGLLLLTLWQLSRPGAWHALYARPGPALAILLSAAILAAGVGSAFFFIPATNLPVIFNHLDAGQFNAAIREAIGWSGVGLVVGVTLLFSGVLALGLSWFLNR